MNADFPALYARHNLVQREYATRAWDVFSEVASSTSPPKISSVFDIGCGTGEVTLKLQERIVGFNELRGHGSDVPEVVAMDVAPQMIQYCKEHHKTVDGSVEFAVADAVNPSTFSESWAKRFDLVTSFTALHWAKDQNLVLENIRTVLKPGGWFLILQSCKAPSAFIKGGEEMKKKWSEYLKDVVPNWRHTPGWENFDAWRKPDPAQGYSGLARKNGFQVLHSKLESFDSVLRDDAYLSGMISTLTPYLKHIPESSRGAFLEDYVNAYKRICPRREVDGETKSVWDGESLVVVGVKKN